mmetsp:Transcript_9735/g.23392  ORF Transcript_9735/g.23392 Transcript_9735/m.23392 type:complete len:263 (-) Transcript_9735:1291-2079(-)
MPAMPYLKGRFSYFPAGFTGASSALPVHLVRSWDENTSSSDGPSSGSRATYLAVTTPSSFVEVTYLNLFLPSAAALAASMSSFILASFASLKRTASRLADRIHIVTITRRMAPRYGVEAANDPKPIIRPCWMRAPPDFPRGLQMTSMAAFPLTCVSRSRGMYAISLHGSKRAYFEPLEKMFCAAPTRTAAYRGVMPRAASMGEMGPENSTSEKKTSPVNRRTVGVKRAATPQPNLRKTKRPKIMRQNVTIPVHVLKSPMKEE